jgi:DNA invertase Pin-like site-specific DNA recombinase
MMISQRTQSAIAAYESRGGVLGTTRLGSWRAAAQANRARATAAYASITPMILELRGEGLSLQAIANILNAEGLTTRRGMPWNSVQVGRVLARAGG